jgi:hypothetical protein
LFTKKEKLPEMKAWLHLLPELIKSVDKFKEALNEFNDFIFENTDFNVEQNEILFREEDRCKMQLYFKIT